MRLISLLRLGVPHSSCRESLNGKLMASTKKARRPIGGTHKHLTDEQRAELERRAAELYANPFMPRLRNGRRIGIVLDYADYRRVQGRGIVDRGIVTDLNSRNRYRIIGANCGLRHCECAKIAIRLDFEPADLIPCRRRLCRLSVPRRAREKSRLGKH
jgi:DNA-binding transcriptional MerR regulator